MANKEDTFEKELKNIKIESKKAPFPDIDFELENGTDDNTINDKIVRPNTSTSLFDNIPDSKELMEEKKVDDVFRELEKTAADLKIHEAIEKEEKKQQKSKKKTTIIIILSVLLVLSISLLFLSMYAYKNREEIKKAAKPTLVPTLETSTSVTENQLPAELTDLNSFQLLVDFQHALSKDYVPANLATPYLNSTTDVIQVNSEAGEMAKQMKAAAESEGISLTVTSGYMNYKEIEERAMDIISMNGEEYAKANGFLAGYNEHQTGLALDFTDDPTNINNTVSFKDTPAGQWLFAHAHEYGFIQRYPEGKESITGVNFEPWHYRYVGVDVANAIYNKGVELNDPNYTFEEYYSIEK